MVEDIKKIAEKFGIKLSPEEVIRVEKELKRWWKPSIKAEEEIIKTKDGSFTLISKEYGEPYHSIYAGAVRECYEKFLLPSGLIDKVKKLSRVTLIDIGFGLGYNSTVAIYHLRKINSKIEIKIYGLDKALPLTLPPMPEPYRNIHTKVWENRDALEREGILIKLIEGDIRNTIDSIEDKTDAIFHDPFSPFRNPEMWTIDLLREVTGKLKEDGIWVSYTSALCVRKALRMLGLFVGESAPVGRKRGGTVCSPARRFELSTQEERKLKLSPYAIPLKDKNLNTPPKEILIRYFSEVVKTTGT